MKTILVVALACLAQRASALELPKQSPTNLVLHVMFTTPDRPVVRFQLQGSGKASISGVIPNTPDRINVSTNLAQSVVTQFYSAAKHAIDQTSLPVPQPPGDNSTGLILTSGGVTISVSAETLDQRFDQLFKALDETFPIEMKRLKPQHPSGHIFQEVQ